MQEKKDNTLSGKNNKRIDTAKATNNEGTAAWSNSEQINQDTHINIPAEYNVEKAKNWVDNGSQL